MNNFSTLIDILHYRAQNQPDQTAYTFLQDGETESISLTYRELEQQARAIAASLQLVVSPGERALLLYPSGLEFIATFFGCLYAGVVAVPAYPPKRNQKMSRLQAIVADSQAKVALTTQEILTNIESRFAENPELVALRWLATDTIAGEQAESWQEPALSEKTLAFLQYTSGSTGTPKGVMVSHGNLLHNLEYIKQAFELTPESVSVSWLPSFHDMGLIDGILQPLYTGFLGVLMPPVSFLQRPLRWLQAISHYRATHCGGPNFAYDLCVNKITPEQRETLELSCWRSAYSGAEPIRQATLERFANTFKSCGFQTSFFYACYGMAETTLMVSGGEVKEEPVYCTLDADALEQNRVVEAFKDTKSVRQIVGCGRSWLDTKIVIADPKSLKRCASDQVGEIWVSGSSVAQGYWRRREQTEQTFHAYLADTGEGPFLRTGDLGFSQDGELFVTGRLKDVIIIRGRNHYPQDIEMTVEQSHPALRPSCGAACSVEIAGEEKLVIVQEVERSYIRKLDANEVIGAIRRAVSEQHEIEVYAVVLLKTASLPKTSSGKVQRSACCAGFLAGSLDVVADWSATPQHRTQFRNLEAEVESLLQQVKNNQHQADSESSHSQESARSQQPSHSLEAIQAWLITRIAEQIGHAQEIDIRQPLAQYGLNSLAAVTISGDLQEWLGRPLLPTLLYDYPTIAALAQHLAVEPGVSAADTPTQANAQTLGEAIAIIGMGCRFPGAKDPKSFWQLLRDGVDAIKEVSPSRWDSSIFSEAQLGKMHSRWGGFLEQVDRFDPQFFGISPREAEFMDPQQRLLLEVSWEALENAGQMPEQLAGSRTGVFIGISSNDYSQLQFNHPTGADAYSGTGNALSIAANRLSYLLDLRGPSWAVDTACSSSLVAVHQACQSLRQGECHLALAGGVNLILNPQLTVTFSKAGMIAVDGRCKTFDAKADGYVRGEGSGVVVLKRLSDALKDGDNILAVIRGSAVTQDGRTNGLTAPNGISQQTVVRQALENAGVAPGQISYVEAHGTGTSLGDPIEINSLKEVLMQDRVPEQSCWIGSVKTNIGHLEAAAGIAGLIKVLLSMQHGEIPPHLHLKQLNPLISLESTPLSIPTEPQQWSGEKERRFAGISSFGFGGTNAHVVLEEAPAPVAVKSEVERPQHLLTLSAKSEKALRELAKNYQDFLATNNDAPLGDICFTANTGRSHFDHRLAVVAKSTVQLCEQLGAFSAGQQTAKLIGGKADRTKCPQLAFLFTGQGSQYIGMGRQLYQTQPTFRETLDRCAEILSPYLEKPLLDVLYPETLFSNPKSKTAAHPVDGTAASRRVGHPAKRRRQVPAPNQKLDETAYTQPALFALEYALAQLWKSWGIEPAVVMGHSVGEYVAACLAGVFSLEDGLKLIAERGRLMQALPQEGEMVAVFADEGRVAAAIQPYSQEVSIAAINGPESLVISGVHQAVEAVITTLETEGVETRHLRVSHAFHSPLMEQMLDAFEQKASQIPFQAPRIPLISNLTGQMIPPGHIPDANYWRRQTRETVRFMAGLNTLFEQGYELFLEIGPKPILSRLGQRCQQEETASWLPSLRQEKDDWQMLLESLSALYLQGVDIDWIGFDRDYLRRKLSLPNYPFQRKRYWIEEGNLPMNRNKSGSKGAEIQIDALPQTKRQDIILSTLRSIVGNLLRVVPFEVDIHAPFLEMGADSIVLIDAVRTIENTYGLKIAIRQLFEELTTIDALAIYIDQNLSPEWNLADSPQPRFKSEEQPQQPEQSTAAIESTELIMNGRQNSEGVKIGSETALEGILRQQLQVMSQQLEVLRGNGLSTESLFSSKNGKSQSAHPTTAPTVHSPKRAQQNQVCEATPSSALVKLEPEQTLPKPFSPLPPWRVAEIRARGLSPQQQRHLEALIARYTQRTQKSKQLTQAYRPVLADNRASAGFRFSTKEILYPIVGKRSQGSRIWDVDDNEYIDITMGFGVNLFGNHPLFITEALEEQLKQGIQLGPQTSLAGEVAQLICELTGMERVTFCNSGTEAVMTALRLARIATGRNKIALFAGSYHGHFDGTLAMAQTGTEKTSAVPIAPGVVQNMVADVLVLNYGQPQSLEVLQAHAGELAAVLVEPVQSRRPDLQPKAFLQQLRQLTRESGIALIFDEMITGLRIHPGGAQAWFGIDADIATYGKIVGGGMPIGVVAGKAVYLDGIDGGMWNYGDASYPQAETTFFAGTFCKHPLAMAAARATLKQIKMQGPALQEQLNQRTSQLAETLNAYFEAEDVPIRIAHFGSLFRFAFTGNMDLLFYHLLEKGVYVWEGRNCFLSTAHTDEDIDYVLQAVKESVEELREGYFLLNRSVKLPKGEKELAEKSGNLTKPCVATDAVPDSAPLDLQCATDEEAKNAGKVPLTEAQKQLWVLAKMGDDGSLAYNVYTSLQLRGPFHLAVMSQAVQKVVDRHEALRTTISSQGDFQYILPSLEVEVPLIDFSSVDGRERESKVAEWFRKQSREPFDLTQGPLFRVHILKLEAQRHLLVLTAHHIVVDGWSMGVILQELGALYSAERQGVVCQLGSPMMQFREYIHWQEQQSQTEEMATHESYWLEKFASSIPVLDLPTDRPRPPVKTYRGDRQTIQLDASLYSDLRQFSTQKGCTLFMTLLSAYTVLLYRLTGQDDIVVGIPVAGRSLEGSGGLVGYCAHLLPVRSCIVGDSTFSKHIVNSRTVLLDAYEHQDYPFARLINKLKIDRDLSLSPIVTVTFNMDRPGTVSEMFDLETSLFAQPISFTGSDLSLDVIEEDGSLVVGCDYNSDLFNPTTIERLLGHFQTLLTAIITNPEQRISDLPLLTSAERHQLLVEWNHTQKPYPQDKGIHQLFEAQVERTPNAVAVVFEDQQLTYRDLNEQANQVAYTLAARGIGPGAYVPILMDRSIELVITLLAVMKTGAAFSPLDIHWPIERLKQTLEDLNCQVVLVNEMTPHKEDVLGWSCQVVNRLALKNSRPNLNIPIVPSTPIYAIYTSGSTGKPKAVVVPHRGITNRFLWMNDFFGRESAIAALQTTHHVYDSAVWQLFWPLINGGKTVIPSPDMGISADNLTALIQKHGVTITDFVPSVFNTLVPQLITNSEVRQKLSSLRTVIVGGEEITPATTYTFLNHFPGVQVVNLYGPTEASIGCICYEVTGNEGNKIPIGKPIANVHVLILDSQRNMVPVGIPGEIYLSGICLGLGYLNDHSKTNAAFVNNPFAEIIYDKLYKTGDLARYLPDGNIEFLGRIDHQVKIRGFRIELGEIEVALAQYPGVHETVVIAREDALANKRLVAYVVTPQGTLTSSELRCYLKTKLPDYMVPSAFMLLESLPLTPSGKVDRRALPAPDASQRELESGFVSPRNPTEETLANLWAEVLGVEQVGIYDNFFELGGDSILSIQIAARANQLGLQLTSKQLFQHQTIAELASMIGTTVSIEAEQGLVTGPVPLTPIQHWFFEQNLPEPHHFNQSVLLEVSPDLKPELLEQVVQHLLAHHDGLRLRFVPSGSGWKQVNTAPDETVPFTVVDLSELASDEQPSALESTAAELQACLNLSEGPIMRVALFHLGIDKPDRLLLIVHHLVVDGVSWRILLEDLVTAYQQLSRGDVIQLPRKTTAFKDWATRLTEYGQSDALASELDYWLAQSRLSIAPLPVDYPSGKAANTIASNAQVSVALSEEQTQDLLHEVPPAYNTQINDVLLTALLQSFAQWTGKRSLLVDLEGHGREELFEDVDLSRTVGWFTTLIPVRLELGEIDHPGETLKSVKEQLRRLPNRGISYGILRYLSQDAATGLKLQPLPSAEVSFNYLGQLDQVLSEPPLLSFAQESSGPTHSPLGSCSHLLEINGFVTAGRLQLDWTYSKNIYQRATVERLAQGFIEALKSLIVHCQSREAEGFTASDFAAARLSQKQLDMFITKIKQTDRR